MSYLDPNEKEAVNLKRTKQIEEIEKLPLFARLELQRRRSIAVSALDDIYNLPKITQPLYSDINATVGILENLYLIHAGIAVALLIANHFFEFAKNIEWIILIVAAHMAYQFFEFRFERLEKSMEFNMLAGKISKAKRNLDDVGVFNTDSLHYGDYMQHRELISMINPYSDIPDELEKNIQSSTYGNMYFYINLDEQLLKFMGFNLAV
jgi:hypothetical protein